MSPDVRWVGFHPPCIHNVLGSLFRQGQGREAGPQYHKRSLKSAFCDWRSLTCRSVNDEEEKFYNMKPGHFNDPGHEDGLSMSNVFLVVTDFLDNKLQHLSLGNLRGLFNVARKVRCPSKCSSAVHFYLNRL
jgi:hypothetical protein